VWVNVFCVAGMCVCVRVLQVCVCVCVCVCMCVCVAGMCVYRCVCVAGMCAHGCACVAGLCVCVCVCVAGMCVAGMCICWRMVYMLAYVYHLHACVWVHIARGFSTYACCSVCCNTSFYCVRSSADTQCAWLWYSRVLQCVLQYEFVSACVAVLICIARGFSTYAGCSVCCSTSVYCVRCLDHLLCAWL